ncbi:MAG: L-threonylcarbamoyladenylate synthase [Aureliella sp.]
MHERADAARKPELCDDPVRAAECLRSGGLVAFPTETVYGLGVDATNPAAVARLFAVKGRPTDNPLIVHVADVDQLPLAAREVPPLAAELLRRFAPGPLTVVVPKRREIVAAVTAGLDSVGVRIPAEPRTRQLLRSAGVPVAAPSANRSGRPSCTTWQSVVEDFGADIDAILIGQPARIGLESTVVDCLGGAPRILRPGAITLEQIQQVDPRATTAGANVDPGENSPGRRHPHYRPRARVHLVDQPQDATADSAAAYLGLQAHSRPAEFGWHVAYASIDDYARAFYEALREVDRRGLKLVFCQRVPSQGTGAALADRLERAAE